MNWTPQSSEEKQDEARRMRDQVGDLEFTSRAVPADTFSQAVSKELRSWSLALAFWGVMSIALSGLDSAWGILLFVVAGLAFLFKDAAMLVVFAVTLGWAAVSNMATLETGGVIFGLIQVVLSVQIFRKYRSLAAAGKAAETVGESQEPETDPPMSRTARFFAPLGCALSMLAAVAALAAFVALMVVVFREIPFESITSIDLIAGLVIDLAVLALAISLAALIARFRWRGLSIAALVVSGLILLGWIALVVTAPPA